MTTYAQAKEAVLEHFLSGFQGLPASSITFENEKFSTPNSTWLRVTIRSLVRNQETLSRKGSRVFRRQVAAIFQIFTPLNQGMKESTELAEEVQNIFEGESISGLDFGTSQIVEAGVDGRWNQTNVSCIFDYDEIK